MINQTNEKTVGRCHWLLDQMSSVLSAMHIASAMLNFHLYPTAEPAGTQEPTKKEDMSIVRSISVSVRCCMCSSAVYLGTNEHRL